MRPAKGLLVALNSRFACDILDAPFSFGSREVVRIMLSLSIA